MDTRAAFVDETPMQGKLLDLGSSDGRTLCHIAELRPDLRLLAADISGEPERYPPGCEFRRVDFNRDPLPWPDQCLDAVTCMQVIEHLGDLENLIREITRVLKPGGRVFFETPHPKTLDLPSAKGKFTLNFYDDSSHTQVVRMEDLSRRLAQVGLTTVRTGVSRNWLFAASHLLYFFAAESRRKYTALVNWLGWSAYLIAKKPEPQKRLA